VFFNYVDRNYSYKYAIKSIITKYILAGCIWKHGPTFEFS
jgi:hypothetical protein